MGRYIQVDINAPSCPKCGSTSRTKYHRTQELRNVRVSGVFYPKVIFRRTSCKRCKQNRVERVLYQEDNSAGRTEELDLEPEEQVSSDSCTHNKTSNQK